MQLHYCHIFRAFIAIAFMSMVSAADETSCVDNSNYRSPRLGLSCAQHKDFDCQEFGVIGYSSDEIADLLLQCPSSCAVEGCAPAALSNNDDHQPQQNNNKNIQTSVKRSRSLRGLLPMSTVSSCPEEWDETCRDDPSFKSKLQLHCSGHVTFNCSVLGAIGFDLQDIIDLISHCPCSCGIECGAPTSSPSSSPTMHPTVTASDSPSLSPTASPTAYPTTLSPTMHPTIAPTTSSPSAAPSQSPSAAPSQSPSAAPSVKVEENPSVIAQVVTSDESAQEQQQEDDSIMGSLPFSSSVFYGIVGAVAFVALVAIVVVMKASRRENNDDMSSSKNSRQRPSKSAGGKSLGTAKTSATRKTTSPKKKHSKRDIRTKRSIGGSAASRSSTSTSRAGSKSASGFKADCLHTRSYNTGARAESTVKHPISTSSGDNCEDDIEANDSMTFTESMYTTRKMPADIEEGAKHSLQGGLGAAPSNGSGKPLCDWSIVDAHGVSGLSDWWNSKSENNPPDANNEKSAQSTSGSAWWDFVGAAQVEMSQNGDEKGTANGSKSDKGEPKQRRGLFPAKRQVMPGKKSLRRSVEWASEDDEAEQGTSGEMLSSTFNTFSGDEGDDRRDHSEGKSRRSRSRSRSRSRARSSSKSRNRGSEVAPASSWFS